ncbi:uncharacterized protein LOC133184047 [Saccostrea echinata]|uniref:uncharacterized protein LOC133184047 n=1 Tax=Saccostrea echinata TaxID=191078 RepID=UPI002A7F7CF0|nr:uncharacterized protein LOC133184047 [Saccostrea echinata]
MRCDVCKTAVVQMHCDTCLVNLCTACVGKHMISDESKNHQVVKFQSRKSTPLYPGCKLHPNERCEMYCKHCDIPICSACVASEKHVSHKISLLREMYSSKRKEIQQDIGKIKANISPTYDGIVADVQMKMDRLETKCKEISESIRKLGDDWHRKIDKVVNQLQTELAEIKNAHVKIIKNHREEIIRDISNIDSYLNSSEEILQSNDMSLLFQYKSKVSTLQKSSPHIDISLPSFSPKEIQQDQILKLFGTLSLTKDDHVYNSNMAKQIAETTPCPPAKQLLDKPETMTTINTGFTFLQNIVCLNNAEIWASGDYSVIQLFSINQKSYHESLIRSFHVKIECFFSGPLHIAVTRNGDLVYCHPQGKKVNIDKKEVPHTIELHNWKPQGVCSTSSDDLLVIMDYDRKTGDFLATMRDSNQFQTKVVRFSDFIEKQTIQLDEEGKPLYPCTSYYDRIKYITENRNLDICVADGEVVVVVNQAGKLRFRYSGHNPSPKWNQKFTPRGIISDILSHILIADEMNKCVHIIDRDGQFLRYIDCGMVKPRGLCIDVEDNLFVADYKKKSGEIMKLKYLK